MDNVLTIAAQGFSVAWLSALIAVPLCMLLARRAKIVDHPGGRKEHERVTPLLGGVGVVVAGAVGLLMIERRVAGEAGVDLRLHEIGFVMAASMVMFLTGLVDDIWKDRMPFQLKLGGQIAAVLILLGPQIEKLATQGGPLREYLYVLAFLGWYLTIVNSFNFSDNMNGLMAGLSIVAFAAALVYLGNQQSLRSLVIALLLIGALLGFLPYNFPRSRIFLGDAGSMFVGFWMAWIQFDMAKGFLGEKGLTIGVSHLIPAVLIMGVPLFDALFVVVMRAREGRPIYLGDNHHLSHRLVRAGFTPTEAVVILWGLGIVLAGVGILAAFALPTYRYLLLVICLGVMIAVTKLIMTYERSAQERVDGEGAAGDRAREDRPR
ncbi:MAG: glycosyltransferase family 4 protein [Planctomycetota bacterium]